MPMITMYISLFFKSIPQGYVTMSLKELFKTS